LSEYYDSTTQSTLNDISGQFQEAFFANNSVIGSKVISEEFGVVDNWNDLRHLPLPDSHATFFAGEIAAALKVHLSRLMGTKLSLSNSDGDHMTADILWSHLTRLFDLVGCDGCFKSVDESFIYHAIGIFDSSIWEQLYLNAKNLEGRGLKSRTDISLIIKILKTSRGSLFGPLSFSTDPKLCFQVIRTLSLYETGFNDSNDLHLKSDISLTLNHYIMCISPHISPTFLKTLACEIFSCLRSCADQTDVNNMLFSFSLLMGSRPRYMLRTKLF
jgi:hypothetical protein